MARFGCPLTDCPIIELLEQLVVLSRPRGRARDVTDNARDVLEAESRRLHGIGIADGLVERTVLPERVVAGEAIPRYRVLHARPRLERRPLVVGGLGWYLFIPPHDRVFVPWADARHDVGDRNSVLRLRHVVHA